MGFTIRIGDEDPVVHSFIHSSSDETGGASIRANFVLKVESGWRHK